MFVHYYYLLITHYSDSYKMYFWHARLLPVPITCIVLYCIVLYCIVLYCIIYIFIHRNMIESTELKVLYCIVLCCAVLCYAVLYCTVLYCTVMYCIVFSASSCMWAWPKEGRWMRISFPNVPVFALYHIIAFSGARSVKVDKDRPSNTP